MRILYIASNPEGANPLQLEREISLLQKKLDEALTTDHLDLRVYSHLNIDELPDVVSRLAPDVIHLAAHGQDDAIMLAHQERGHVRLDGRMLGGLLAATRVRPKLLLLNACNSAAMAETLTGHADFVIGTDAPISNVGARSMAATLYSLLASGSSLGSAFDAAKNILDIIDQESVQAILYPQGSAPIARRTTLTDPLRIIANFPAVEKWLDKEHVAPQKGFNPSEPAVQFGVAGAPESTRQIQFFTDDSEVIADETGSLAEARGWMLEQRPFRGEIWVEPYYSYYGDMWWYTSVVTSERKIHCASATTVAALRRYYFDEEWRGPVPPDIASEIETAIRNLEINDGSRRSLARRARAQS